MASGHGAVNVPQTTHGSVRSTDQLIFFHFATAPMAEAILRDGLSYGHLRRSSGEIIQPIVWLTTDASPCDHGLLTGKEILTESQIDYLQRVTDPVRNTVTANKREMRLKVKVPKSDRRLVSFWDYCRKHESEDYAKAFRISALDDKDQAKATAGRTLQFGRTKERTWWLYQGVISPLNIMAADFDDSGTFISYQFEPHGRAAFEHAGFAPASPAAQAELEQLYEPRYPLDIVRAVCFCHQLDHPPYVLVRGRGIDVALRLSDSACIHGKIPANNAGLMAWLTRHRADLEQRWQQAVNLYRQFYPDRKSCVPDL